MVFSKVNNFFGNFFNQNNQKKDLLDRLENSSITRPNYISLSNNDDKYSLYAKNPIVKQIIDKYFLNYARNTNIQIQKTTDNEKNEIDYDNNYLGLHYIEKNYASIISVALSEYLLFGEFFLIACWEYSQSEKSYYISTITPYRNEDNHISISYYSDNSVNEYKICLSNKNIIFRKLQSNDISARQDDKQYNIFNRKNIYIEDAQNIADELNNNNKPRFYELIHIKDDNMKQRGRGMIDGIAEYITLYSQALKTQGKTLTRTIGLQAIFAPYSSEDYTKIGNMPNMDRNEIDKIAKQSREALIKAVEKSMDENNNSLGVIFTDSMPEFKDMRIPESELSYNNLIQDRKKDLLDAMGVPMSLYSETKTAYSSAEERAISAHIENTIKGHLYIIFEKIFKYLKLTSYITFNIRTDDIEILQAIKRSNDSQKINDLIALLKAGVIATSEVREKLVENGDVKTLEKPVDIQDAINSVKDQFNNN